MRAVCSADVIAVAVGAIVAAATAVDCDSVVVAVAVVDSDLNLDHLCDDFLVVALVAIFLVVPAGRHSVSAVPPAFEISYCLVPKCLYWTF